MSLTNHLTELRKKHRALDVDIEVRQRQPAHCPLELRELKKQKLVLKDRIAAIENDGADIHDIASLRADAFTEGATSGDMSLAEVSEDSIQAVG